MNNSAGPQEANKLVFLKLGGSLITDKRAPRTPRKDVLDRLAAEIQAGLAQDPELKILLGHGSGSFGHTSGSLHHTREGVSSPGDWAGFSEVWADAADLHRLVMSALRGAGLPALGFPPSASVLTHNREIAAWNLDPIRSALENGLLPVVYGDVVFDSGQGGTILSTEDLFFYLAGAFKPQRILLAGRDQGVCQDFPDCKHLYTEITPDDKDDLRGKVNPSEAPDVTGGMGEKVDRTLDLISKLPDLEALIFSGEQAGNLQLALNGGSPGTRLHS